MRPARGWQRHDRVSFVACVRACVRVLSRGRGGLRSVSLSVYPCDVCEMLVFVVWSDAVSLLPQMRWRAVSGSESFKPKSSRHPSLRNFPRACAATAPTPVLTRSSQSHHTAPVGSGISLRPACSSLVSVCTLAGAARASHDVTSRRGVPRQAHARRRPASSTLRRGTSTVL